MTRKGRNAIIEKINQQAPKITSSTVCSCKCIRTVSNSRKCQGGVAEAVGSAISTPADLIIIKQPVDELVETKGQIIDPTTGKLTGDNNTYC